MLLLVVDVGAAEQPRERRQERRTQPKQPASQERRVQPELPLVTTLFEQKDVPYMVQHAEIAGQQICQLFMADRESKSIFVVQATNSNQRAVVVQNYYSPLPTWFARPKLALNLRVEVDGVAQSYSVVTGPPKDDGSGSAETLIPRLAFRHLQAAVNSRSGMLVTVENGPAIRFNVPPRAADAFHECTGSILPDRTDGAADRLKGTLEGARSRS